MSRKTDASSAGGSGLRVFAGSYVGDNAATQAIVGVGFKPKYVVIYHGLITYTPAFKTDQDGTLAVFYDGGNGAWRWLTDMIRTLDADGFTVGDGTGFFNVLNVLGTTYSYTCIG